MAGRVDLDGSPIKPITICMIGAGGFIGSHLCEKLMSETEHKVLAVDVYNDKIKHLLEPESLPWAGRIQFHRLNIKNDSRLEGLIKMADLVILSSLSAFLSSSLSFFSHMNFLFSSCRFPVQSLREIIYEAHRVTVSGFKRLIISGKDFALCF